MAYPGSDDRATAWDIDPESLRLPLIIARWGDVKEAPENTLPAF